MRFNLVFAVGLLSGGLLHPTIGRAQDPSQPATNLGLTNVLDGAPPGPGTYWFQYLQHYRAARLTNGAGRRLGSASISTFLSLQQLVLIARSRWLGGNPGITVLLPVVSLNAAGEVAPGQPLRANPGALGDLVVGPNIQWFGRRLLGRPFLSRLELDALLPTGAYDAGYAVNPGANFFTLEPHYTFTWQLTERLSTSQRHHYAYNFFNPGTDYRTGQLYHLNYALEYLLGKTFRLGVAGYYCQQLSDDERRGEADYFRRAFQLANTRERVLAAGPSLSLITRGGLFVELKTALETAAENRPEGFRTTCRFIYRFPDVTPPAP